MKYFYLVFFAFFVFGCSSNKNFLERSDDSKGLADAIKQLNKNPDDADAKEAIPILYKRILKDQESKIDIYKATKDEGRWDKILLSYQKMQNAYESVMESNQAFKLLSPNSYSTNILEIKDSAAAEFYNSGIYYLSKEGRENAKKAFSEFKKVEKYVPGYKDVVLKIDEAFERATINIIIFPVEDNSYFNSYGMGNSGINYSNEYFQRTLVRELNDKRYAVRVYSDRDARDSRVNPDWTISLILRNLDIPYPSRSSTRRNSSAQVEVGTDTSGRPVYRTIYATIDVTKSSFIARADMQVIIKDVVNNKNISTNSFREDYRWEQESATYSGDYRALSSYDKRLIDNAYTFDSNPRKEEILNELYRKLYPRILSDVRYKINW
ncbi:MAG: hypothetical protein ABIP68_09740 [Ferruginibacter sp.]